MGTLVTCVQAAWWQTVKAPGLAVGMYSGVTSQNTYPRRGGLSEPGCGHVSVVLDMGL